MHSIRPLRAADIPAVIEIAGEQGLSYWSKKDYTSELALDKSITLRLETPSDQCAGFLVGRLVPGLIADQDAELYNIGVRTAYQRLGLGSALMSEFIDRAARLNARNIWLDVRSSNQSAISFYQSFGFISDGTRRNFYSNPAEDGELMRLVI